MTELAYAAIVIHIECLITYCTILLTYLDAGEPTVDTLYCLHCQWRIWGWVVGF